MLLKEKTQLQGEKGRYQIQGKIGSESTFGAVYKALDAAGEPVVVKQLLAPGRVGRDMGLDVDYVRQTFEREAYILTHYRLPQMVQGIDYFAQDDNLFLVMEYINGEDLDQMLVRRLAQAPAKPFSEAEAVSIGRELCRAIHAIHQLPGQILYRDLKPRNIMWDAATRGLKIIDFGTARFMEAGRHPTQALGTPGYAPPEFYSTKATVSLASDVYTIGATLFELVTGEQPEPLMTPNHFYGREGSLSDAFRGIVCKAMAQSASDRFQTAADMERALARLDHEGREPAMNVRARNPYPYLSCLCTQCGRQPRSDASVFCSRCGGKIHVMMLSVQPKDGGPPMDLFLDKSENTIGRADEEEGFYPDIDLSRFDPNSYVSRRHCVLKRDGTAFYLRTFKTTNQTLLNGYPLVSQRDVPLENGASLQLADIAVTFRLKPCLKQKMANQPGEGL